MQSEHINPQKFDELKSKFGSHVKAAKELGISYRQYTRWKTKNEAPPYIKRLIDFATQS